MTFNVNISSTTDEKEWNDNLSKSFDSTIYQTFNWQKLYQHSFGSKPFFITVSNDEGNVVGQLACLIHENMFWEDTNFIIKNIANYLSLGGASLWWYHGPIIHDEIFYDEILKIILTSVDKIAKDNDVVNIRGISSPLSKQFSNKNFEKYDYKIQPWSTYITDLKQDSETIFSSLNKKTRYDIRKAENNKLELEIIDNIDSLKKIFELKLIVKNKSKKKSNKIQNSFLYSHWNFLYEKQFEKAFLVKCSGEYIGGIVLLQFNNNIIQHFVVNSSKTNLQGGPFLTWNVIKWGIKNNLSYFDVGGINPQPQSEKEIKIDYYKSKWIGKKYDYFFYTKVINQKKYYFSTALRNPNRILSKYHRYKQSNIVNN
jgi:hypothetical protein